MGLNSNYGTDPVAEAEGIWLELDGETKVKIRRAGGGNKEYENLHSKMLEPYQSRLRMVGKGKIPKSLEGPLKDIVKTCYARTVVVGWQTKIGETWHDGIEPYKLDDKGRTVGVPYEGADELIPVTEASIKKLLTDYPEVFTDILEFCGEAAVFKAQNLEAMEGNS